MKKVQTMSPQRWLSVKETMIPIMPIKKSSHA